MLQGNLEDLPLLDIIQIVSFGKKTGYLSIQMEGGDGAIVFQHGLVVCAFTATSAPGDARLAGQPWEAREKAVRNRIGLAMEQLARLREGAFGFELTERVPTRIGAREIAVETLATGINPQEMLLQLAQGIDEDRAQSAAAVEASFAAPEEAIVQSGPMAAVLALEATPAALPTASATPAPPPAEPAQSPKPRTKPSDTLPPGARPAVRPQPSPVEAPPPTPEPAEAQPRTILLVDDEADVRQILSRHFAEAGYQIEEAGDPDAAAKVAGRLREAGKSFVLVTDLGMPATGGASFHGGFEVVKRLWKMNLRPPILMMTESLSQPLRLRAKQMGVQAFVFKPTLSKLNPRQFEADLAAFAGKLSSDVLPRLLEIAALRPPARLARPAATDRPLAPGGGEAARSFELLRRRLLALRQGGDANQIAVLVMKVAREHFERAMLFVVKNDEARGLGGFGLAPRDETLNLLARQITIPFSEASIFREVADSRKPFAGPLPPDRWSGHVMGRIGRFQSKGTALLPLVAHRQTIALLFGDNPESGKDVGRLAALEVFVEQAGIALENVFLQRKLQTVEGKEQAGLR